MSSFAFPFAVKLQFSATLVEADGKYPLGCGQPHLP